MNIKKYKKYAPQVVRIGMASVFLWFGVSQILQPSYFMGYMPDWVNTLPISSDLFIIMNGVFEVVFGGLLAIGYFTRFSAAILSLHLLGIIQSLGYNDIAIRDLGLLFGLVSVVLHGPDDWCKGKK
jgi:uncharacterized membrane protein YphA (DoxX/SURF4 family)